MVTGTSTLTGVRSSEVWAIRNKRTKLWVYGTDRSFADGKARQRTSADRALIFRTEEEARNEMRWRSCGKDYEAVPVRVMLE